jgi:hypothetical protein
MQAVLLGSAKKQTGNLPETCRRLVGQSGIAEEVTYLISAESLHGFGCEIQRFTDEPVRRLAGPFFEHPLRATEWVCCALRQHASKTESLLDFVKHAPIMIWIT